jgi:hypothetical protein
MCGDRSVSAIYRASCCACALLCTRMIWGCTCSFAVPRQGSIAVVWYTAMGNSRGSSNAVRVMPQGQRIRSNPCACADLSNATAPDVPICVIFRPNFRAARAVAWPTHSAGVLMSCSIHSLGKNRTAFALLSRTESPGRGTGQARAGDTALSQNSGATRASKPCFWAVRAVVLAPGCGRVIRIGRPAA